MAAISFGTTLKVLRPDPGEALSDESHANLSVLSTTSAAPGYSNT